MAILCVNGPFIPLERDTTFYREESALVQIWGFHHVCNRFPPADRVFGPVGSCFPAIYEKTRLICPFVGVDFLYVNILLKSDKYAYTKKRFESDTNTDLCFAWQP